ncbi:hypothetical protein ASPWEDRAFT_69841 [Aspergillus wentii DTO 134E9]|uniref:NodB homology domain-containing protein n=1 Tax=Aspergillus wentii DTO 134E9 TaxID=1073089 RepID=A0A1L9RGN9_ASPWE|nr:uncharacterized protein ASPWEDRAFT_69841 [Aspergillus wentii DTO 134E9]OJJ34106.1 hypothetical protein ASPWEDRAFT_69841 [Aspergillus wentii DTO 134E9]
MGSRIPFKIIIWAALSTLFTLTTAALQDGIVSITSPFQRWAKNDTIVIDTFRQKDKNDLGFWHGAGEDLRVEYGAGYVRFFPTDPDQNFHTQLADNKCISLLPYRGKHLHVVFSGTLKFGISLNQHNQECNPRQNPYPATWDTVEAGRYARGNEIYVPLEHFQIDQSRVVSVSFNGFYSRESLTLYKVEIIPDLPKSVPTPSKLPSGQMALRCSRPNSFAFGIDDGQPRFAQEVMKILEEEGILVTFFVVGAGLRNEETNFTRVYREMLKRGHQIALHSTTHQKMEGLQTVDEMDEEIAQNVQVFKTFLETESRYFRPPFGTIGARSRQRLAALLPDPYIVNWSVDIEDWLWAETETPERQVDAFVRDVKKGGNLVVMHYLHPSTVRYFRDIIRFVKSTGVDIMRID